MKVTIISLLPLIINALNEQKNKPPASLMGVIYGCSGVREGCKGVSPPIPYRGVSLVKTCLYIVRMNHEMKLVQTIFRRSLSLPVWGWDNHIIRNIIAINCTQNNSYSPYQKQQNKGANYLPYTDRDLPVTTFIWDSNSTRTNWPLISTTRPR